MDERAIGGIGGEVAESYDLAKPIDGAAFGAIADLHKAELGEGAVAIGEGLRQRAAFDHRAGDFAVAIDAIGVAGGAAGRAEIGERAAVENAVEAEGASIGAGVAAGVAGDLSLFVDAHAEAGGPAGQRADVAHGVGRLWNDGELEGPARRVTRSVAHRDGDDDVSDFAFGRDDVEGAVDAIDRGDPVGLDRNGAAGFEDNGDGEIGLHLIGVRIVDDERDYVGRVLDDQLIGNRADGRDVVHVGDVDGDGRALREPGAVGHAVIKTVRPNVVRRGGVDDRVLGGDVETADGAAQCAVLRERVERVGEARRHRATVHVETGQVDGCRGVFVHGVAMNTETAVDAVVIPPSRAASEVAVLRPILCADAGGGIVGDDARAFIEAVVGAQARLIADQRDGHRAPDVALRASGVPYADIVDAAGPVFAGSSVLAADAKLAGGGVGDAGADGGHEHTVGVEERAAAGFHDGEVGPDADREQNVTGVLPRVAGAQNAVVHTDVERVATSALRENLPRNGRARIREGPGFHGEIARGRNHRPGRDGDEIVHAVELQCARRARRWGVGHRIHDEHKRVRGAENAVAGDDGDVRRAVLIRDGRQNERTQAREVQRARHQNS